MNPQIIRYALDWFEHSFSGELSDSMHLDLIAKKELAKASDTPQPITLGDTELFVLPKSFGYWTFVLGCPQFDIRLAASAGASHASASIRLSAFGLANTEPSTLWEEACACLAKFGTYTPLAISRVDVAADFQGWQPTREDMSSIVCAAHYRATHGTESGVETFQFGKGDVVMRLYDKTTEIGASGKVWMYDAWSITRRYDDTKPVWRVEVQLRRKTLQELGIHCAADVFDNPGALLGFGLDWANLRVPTSDKTKTRWPEDPRWTQLKQAVSSAPPMQRTVKPSMLMSLERTISQYVGAISTAAAYFGVEDFDDANVMLAYAAQVHMMEKDTDFQKLVETKRRRLLAGT